jgi:hypothetical protein
VDGLDLASRPPRPRRVERTRRQTWSRALSEVFVPYRHGSPIVTGEAEQDERT